MLQDVLLTDEEKEIKEEVREFVKNEVPSELLKRMDRDEITYPREFLEALGKRNLLGLRFSREYGGRGLDWTGEIAALEEIGVLGMALGCAFSMPSIVGEALHTFGSEDLKERFLRPMLKGELVSAEALTEPRGGSDFFGATTIAKLEGDYFRVKGQKRFVVADLRLPSARRLVSEAKKFATDICWAVCNQAMRIVGGIGYTNVFPIEKMVRDARLAQIWTGTNEIMSLLIQHEYYKELLNDPNPPRMNEEDAEEAHLEDEKVYEDDEMWTKGW